MAQLLDLPVEGELQNSPSQEITSDRATNLESSKKFGTNATGIEFSEELKRLMQEYSTGEVFDQLSMLDFDAGGLDEGLGFTPKENIVFEYSTQN